MNKQMTMAEVVGQLQDGMTIGIGGWGPRRKPMALIREILRSDLKDLTIVAYGGADVGMLCAAGKVRKLVFAFVSLDFIPLEPYFRKARQGGEIEVMEIDEGMMVLGLKAAGYGCPYIPTKIGLGTDVPKINPDIKVIDSPYDDKEWVAMPALNLDAALVHVDRADSRGVCQIKGPDHYMDDLFVRAADKVYATCDDLVEDGYFHEEAEARYVFWERAQTTGVVHAPLGAHPSSCWPEYGFDVAHFKTYTASAKDEKGFQGYFDEYVACSEEEYLQKVGGEEAIRKLPKPVF
jgi:glutaconate CoA-transferase subunit A